MLANNPICAHPGCQALATEDDHIIGWAARGSMTIAEWNARTNHQGLCHDHHAAKTRREANAGRHPHPK